MGLLLQHQIVHEQAKNEIFAAVAPTLLHGDPQNSRVAQQVVAEARSCAIAQGFMNDNLLIAGVLEQAGIHHIPVGVSNPAGPDFLTRTSYPELFAATDHLEFGDKAGFIRAVGGVVDAYTPDALYVERGIVLYGLVAAVIKDTPMRFKAAANAFTLGKQTIKDVLTPFDQDLEPKGWTVSPYARTLAPFIIKQAS